MERAANENKAAKGDPIRTFFFGIISQDWAKNHMKLKRHFTSTRYFNIQRRFLHLRNYRNMLSKLVEIYRFELGRIESYSNVLPLCSI